MRLALVIVFELAGLLAAQAATPDYLDDRSTPEALVKSLYNAIDRKEYARAYSYFSPPPAKSLEDYTKGFADTASVDVVTGTASSEGAAGSVFYSLPVAIRAVDTSGADKVFAGCYTLRLANPQIQAEDFKPLHIEKGTLKPAEGPLEEALPERCGDGPPPPEKDAALEEAKAQFAAIYGDTCNTPSDSPDAEKPVTSYEIEFNYPLDPQDQPKRKAHLYRFWCMNGAYNSMHVYFLSNDMGEVRPLHFAEPELDIRYQDDDPDKKVTAMNVIGFTTTDQLVNSDYDPQTYTLDAHERWRGIGDASSTGTWIFRSGTFSLVRYEVDASYDGEINPQTVLDYATGP
jgi:hypothetical protein